METTLIFIVLIILVAIVTIFSWIKIVPQGQEWTVERLGRYVHTLKPGLSFVTPFIERIGYRLSMQETVLDIPSQEVITKDNATVTADGVVFFQVFDAAKAAYEVQNLQLALINLSMTNIRSVIGSMDLDEVLSNREHINRRLLAVIDQATTPWGVKVTRIELRNIQPPGNLLEAMGKQMTAERTKRADILTAEGDRQAQILRAEGHKQSAILQAEGEREAAFRQAEARERLAEAEAKATQMVSNAIAGGNTAAINYFVAQKYIEAFGKLAESHNQKLVLMPMEATGMLSSLAGIGELMRDTLQGRSGGGAPPAPQPPRGGAGGGGGGTPSPWNAQPQR